MKHNRGSNQYRDKWGFYEDTKKSVLIIVIFILLVVIAGREWVHAHPIVSPCPDSGCNVVYAAEKVKLPPTLPNIASYIAQVFEKEGVQVVVKAINCFASESSLRHDAYNWNSPYTDKNGVYHPATEDKGIAQINSIHGLSDDDAYDFQTNIDKAYQIYKQRGNFSAWYGRGCQ